uniref:Uncharacterized protein n=1 Tax=Paramoeba aestuarina TaxID=180227 RepID=A0A7S4KQA6_9EUKA
MPLFDLLKGFCERLTRPFRNATLNQSPKVTILPPPEIPIVQSTVSPVVPSKSVKASKNNVSKTTSLVVVKEKRQVGYGHKFWMSHYRALTRMFPDFKKDQRKRIMSSAIPQYIRLLEESGEACPSVSVFRNRMKNILRTGNPKGRAGGCIKAAERKTKMLPNHFEVMNSLQGTKPYSAAQLYNLEIWKHFKGKQPYRVSKLMFMKWRKAFRDELRASQKVQKTLMKVKSTCNLQLTEPPKRKTGKEFWVWHLKRLVKAHPTVLMSVKNTTRSSEIEKYRNSLKKRKLYCPSGAAFRTQLQNVLKSGEPVDGPVGHGWRWPKDNLNRTLKLAAPERVLSLPKSVATETPEMASAVVDAVDTEPYLKGLEESAFERTFRYVDEVNKQIQKLSLGLSMRV